jgi:hypothetical protein
MYKASFNITISSEKKLDIEEIKIKTRDGSDDIFELELEEEEYEEDECGHIWDGEAYLLAAAHFLHSWPDSWSGEELAKNLFLDEWEPDIEEQKKIKVWHPLAEYCEKEKINPFLFAEEQIADMADTLIRYKNS